MKKDGIADEFWNARPIESDHNEVEKSHDFVAALANENEINGQRRCAQLHQEQGDVLGNNAHPGNFWVLRGQVKQSGQFEEDTDRAGNKRQDAPGNGAMRWQAKSERF